MKINEVRRTRFDSRNVEDVSEMSELILRDCQPYLNEIDGQIAKYVMMRGIPGHGQHYGFGKRQTRLDGRNSRNTPAPVHHSMNIWFDHNYGHPYRNGVFTTGEYLQAAQYGDIYAVFPIGKFDYLWVRGIPDMFILISPEITPTIEALERAKEVGRFKSDNLKTAITTGSEIMLWTEEYYYIELRMLEQIGKFLQ